MPSPPRTSWRKSPTRRRRTEGSRRRGPHAAPRTDAPDRPAGPPAPRDGPRRPWPRRGAPGGLGSVRHGGDGHDRQGRSGRATGRRWRSPSWGTDRDSRSKRMVSRAMRARHGPRSRTTARPHAGAPGSTARTTGSRRTAGPPRLHGGGENSSAAPDRPRSCRIDRRCGGVRTRAPVHLPGASGTGGGPWILPDAAPSDPQPSPRGPVPELHIRDGTRRVRPRR